MKNYKWRYQPLWKERPRKWWFLLRRPTLTLLHVGPLEFCHKRGRVT